jgi:hypothetical protein
MKSQFKIQPFQTFAAARQFSATPMDDGLEYT